MFVKLFTQILDSSIADDRRLRHFFTDLLLCADPKGYVMMTESAIARRIGTTLEEVEWGIAELEKPDPRSKTPDMEGRRIERLEGTGYGWRIINFEAYKFLKSADEMREKTKERVRKHRENKALQSGNGAVTPCNAGNTTKRKKQTQTQRQNEEEENNPPPPPPKNPKAPKMSDDQFIQSLKTNPAYQGIDIDIEIGRMNAWLLTKPNRKLTRPFIVNWLNRIDKPMTIAAPASGPRCFPGEMTPSKPFDWRELEIK